MKWMISEEKLGPDQREVINDLSREWKNTWIKGHAGSGKSVLLIHLLRDYLAKNSRAKVCVVVFTNSLVDMLTVGIKELNLERKFSTSIPVMTIYKFDRSTEQYDAVFCDEVQDIPANVLISLNARAGKVIVAGDEAQSIYNSVPGFGEAPATPEQVKSILNANEKPLHYIYRMTRSVVALLSKVFTSLLSGKPNVEKNDVEIKFCKAKTLSKELEYVWLEASKTNRLRPDEIVAILVPHIEMILTFADFVLQHKSADTWEPVFNKYNKHDFDSLNGHLKANNIPLIYVGQGYGSLSLADSENKIILMTYNSAKGLDFDHVFLPMLGENIYIPDNKAETLLFVALSRSKYNLMVSYTGNLYSLMEKFMRGKTPYEIESGSTGSASGRVII